MSNGSNGSEKPRINTAAAANGNGAARALRALPPTVVVQKPVEGFLRFPPQLDFDVMSPNNVASRRRGRYVIKLAAALFLATQDDFDTPGRCASAMNVLWGHTRLAEEYLRRHRAPGTPRPTYTPKQLSKAEGQWKMTLGETVLEANGFYRCWDDLVSFFRSSVDEMRQDKTAFSTPPLSSNASTTGSTGEDESEGEQDVPVAHHHRGIPPPPTPPAAPAPVTQPTLFLQLRPESPVSPTVPSLDLSKVPARGLSLLYVAALRYVRLASVARRAAYPNTSADEEFLASRGWLPVAQVIDGVFTDVGADSALKQLWTWLATLRADAATAVFVSVLLAMSYTGELQYLHADVGGEGGGGGADVSSTATLQRLSSITHLRAVWGHEDENVAAAVMREHPRVPLRSLVSGEPDSAGDSPTKRPRSPRQSGWFEYVEDTKTLRKDLTDLSGPLYSAEKPFQVLLSRSMVADLFAPLSPPCTATLQSLLRRTKVPENVPGAEGSCAFGSAAPNATFVSEEELLELLSPSAPRSTVACAAFVAAKTFYDSRLSFVPIMADYFTKQESAVSGREVALHVVRAARTWCDADMEGDDPHSAFSVRDRAKEVSAVAAPHSARLVVVSPSRLSYGVLSSGAVSPSSATCVVDVRAVYHFAPTLGPQRLVLWRPPTELLVDLRIASLWDLWLWYGFYLSPTARGGGGANSATQRRANTHRYKQLLYEEEMSVSLKFVVPATAATAAATRDGAATSASVKAAAAGKQPETDALSGELLLSAVDDVAEAIPRYEWEFFPTAQAEALALRLDELLRTTLQNTCQQWLPRGMELLRPPCASRSCGGEVSSAATTGTRGGDVLHALLSRDTVEPGRAPELPHWQVRERALWAGLGLWMRTLQTACDMPPFSLLLPPATPLQWPDPSSVVGADVVAATMLPPQTDVKRAVGFVGRKKGVSALRRLFDGPDAPTIFYIKSEQPYTQRTDSAGHRMWVVETEKTDTTVAPRLGGDKAWQTIADRPEVLLAAARDLHDEQVVTMYLRYASVLHCSRARPRISAGAATAEGDSAALRLLRFVGRPGGAAKSGEEGSVAAVRVAAESPERMAQEREKAKTTSQFGVLEELPAHAPQRHAHAGCRVTPLACDEIVLGAAWPAEAIVDYGLVPPLAEALEVYCAKLRWDAEAASRHSSKPSTCPSAAARAVMVDDLRRELRMVLTDTAAMELREFYGDSLLDYCAAVATLSYRHASTNSTIWRGGNITGSSTNSALVVGALPAVLREYWMSRRRVCNEKRLADCVESLFGAVAMALWVLPLRRRRAADVRSGVEVGVLGPTNSSDVFRPDADLLIYVASALLELLSGGVKAA